MAEKQLTRWFLQGYDSHCNIVLGDVEETIYVVDEEDEAETEPKVIANHYLL